MATHLKSEAESLEHTNEVCAGIDQNGGLGNRHLLSEFPEKQHRSLGGTRLKQPDVQELVGFGIDGGVQPVAFLVELDHGLVDRDVIQFSVTGWLYVGFLHPVVDRGATAFDTQPLEELLGIRK